MQCNAMQYNVTQYNTIISTITINFIISRNIKNTYWPLSYSIGNINVISVAEARSSVML